MEDIRNSPVFREVMRRMKALGDGSDEELWATLLVRKVSALEIVKAVRETVGMSIGERTVQRWQRTARQMKQSARQMNGE